MRKLNLGSGFTSRPDFINVDKLNYKNNIIANVLEGLPFTDNNFDFVLMNHTLQMFTYEELPIVLAEVRRVMKSTATLRILTPDIVQAFYAYFDLNDGYFPISDFIEKTIGGKLARYIYWHGDTKCGFDYSALEDLLIRNEFRFIKPGSFGECELDSRQDESLIVVCQK